MRYEEFRDELGGALRDEGFSFAGAGDLLETVELTNTVRRCRFQLWLVRRKKTEPFDCTAAVSFEWSPYDAARSFTCEEDLLADLLGRNGERKMTERRQVRVDFELYAGLPYGSATPVPDSPILGSWAGKLGQKFDHLVVEVRQRRGRVVSVKGGCEEIRVETRCGPDGTLVLRSLSLSAFRLVHVPRVWDDRRRSEREESATAGLDDAARRFKLAADVWVAGIAELAAIIRYLPPPPDAELARALFEDHDLPFPEV